MEKTNTKEVLRFVNSFIKADYDANMARYTEKDYDKFDDIVCKTKKFLHKEIVHPYLQKLGDG